MKVPVVRQTSGMAESMCTLRIFWKFSPPVFLSPVSWLDSQVGFLYMLANIIPRFIILKGSTLSRKRPFLFPLNIPENTHTKILRLDITELAWAICSFLLKCYGILWAKPTAIWVREITWDNMDESGVGCSSKRAAALSFKERNVWKVGENQKNIHNKNKTCFLMYSLHKTKRDHNIWQHK